MHMKGTCIQINACNFSERQHAKRKQRKWLKLPQNPTKKPMRPTNGSLMQMSLAAGVTEMRKANIGIIFRGDHYMFTDHDTETDCFLFVFISIFYAMVHHKNTVQ